MADRVKVRTPNNKIGYIDEYVVSRQFGDFNVKAVVILSKSIRLFNIHDLTPINHENLER